MRAQTEPSTHDDDLVLHTYTLMMDALLECDSAEAQLRMVRLLLCHATVIFRFLNGHSALEEFMRKIETVDVGPDWLQQVMRMHWPAGSACTTS